MTVNGHFSLVCIPQMDNFEEQGSGFCVTVKVWPWCVTANTSLQACITAVSDLFCVHSNYGRYLAGLQRKVFHR